MLLGLSVPFSSCSFYNTLMQTDADEVGYFTCLVDLTLLVCTPVVLGMRFICTPRLKSTCFLFADTPAALLTFLVCSNLDHRRAWACL